MSCTTSKIAARTVIVDAAMNDFMRPVLYDATHPVTRAQRTRGALTRTDIVGPVCESGNCFLRDGRSET